MQPFPPFVSGHCDVAYQTTIDLRLRAQKHFRCQAEEKAALTSIEQFEAHREKMRRRFLDAIGGLPGPEDASHREPVEAKITGRLERGSFTVDKLIYESLPGYPVSAALYKPQGQEQPRPAVVMVHGHSNDGKAYPFYQAVCIDLASNGFIVLAIDPIGQGERCQSVKDGKSRFDYCTYEHTHYGIPFWLGGKSIARHFIWDIVRGTDYLSALPEVDAARIAITGNSGGGTQCCYAMITDPRLAAAMPCTFIVTLESYQRTAQPQDAEQIIPGCMVHGPDHDDYLTAMAPRPVMVGAVAYDFFPIEGTREAVERARRIYSLYGKEENIALTVAASRHENAPQLRQACVNWFRRHLMGVKTDYVTGEPELFKENELWATPTGFLYGGSTPYKTLHDLNELPAPPFYPNVEAQRQALREVLRIDGAGELNAPIDVRILSEETEKGYPLEKLYFLSSPEISVTGVLLHPSQTKSTESAPATLLLLEQGTNGIEASWPLIESILQKGHKVLVFDVRGYGALTEYGRDVKGDFGFFNHEYKLACDAMMLDLCLPGLRVFDVLRGCGYLKRRADVSQVHLHGIKSGAFFAFLAAALDTEIASLTCQEMTASLRETFATPDYSEWFYDLRIIVPGLLNCVDLPEQVCAVAGRITQ